MHVFSVNNVELVHGSHTARLHVSSMSWKDAFPEMRIKFGHTTDRHVLRRHIFPRQAASTTTAFFDPQATNIIPSASPAYSATTATIDLNSNVQNKALALPFGLPMPSNVPIKVSCKSCKTTGTLVFQEADISFNSEVLDSGGDLMDAISGGSIQLDISGFSAHVELDITPAQKGKLTFAVLTVPVFAISVWMSLLVSR
jgi:hypothetical protein